MVGQVNQTELDILYKMAKIALGAEKTETIVRTFEICWASHVTKNLDYPCAKIRAVMNSKLSVFLVRTT